MDDDDIRRRENRFAVVLLALLVLAIMTLPSLAHPPGAPLEGWFNKLQSSKGKCCGDSDGFVLKDPDWESINGHYRVHIPRDAAGKDLVWVDVPDEAVLKEPNLAGPTMVWPIWQWPGVNIRCFLPGVMM